MSLPSPAARLCVANTSFSAYHGPSRNGRLPDAPTHFVNLAIYFEAEKFRPHNPVLFEELVHCPTLKEARKTSKRYRQQWRDDWAGVRQRVMANGLWYLNQYNPGLISDHHDLSTSTLVNELCEIGLPAKFLEQSVQTFVALDSGPRYVFFCAPDTPGDVIGKRLNFIHRKHGRHWVLHHWLGRHSMSRIHDWAINQFIPVRYSGHSGKRLSHAEIATLAQMGPVHCVVFESRKGRAMDSVLQNLKDARLPVCLEVFRPQSSP